jgi:fatty-acyl-CoA synthase
VETDGARPGDPVVAFTTSGSTGRPKLAAHDHATTIRHIEAAATAFRVTPASVGLLALPVCGTFGFVTLLSMLAGGGRVVIPPRFEVAEAAGLIETHRVTHLNASDDMILALLAQDRDLGSWAEGVFADFTGRGEESATAAEKVGARLTGVYGSSETFALLTRWPAELPLPERARNGGIPVDPAVEVRVVDPESGVPIEAGSAGELQIRGPSVLTGYIRADGLADPPLVDGGWLPTGDLAEMAPDGGFVYLARLGDTLRLAGFLTDPVEIEQRLLGHPRVRGAQVVGARKPAGGDAAVAFVIRDGDVEEAELVAHCRAGLANYKVPARVVFVEAFPTVDGANGVKILKPALRQQAAALDLGSG